MTDSPLVVVKVGGSLLGRPDLVPRLQGLIDSRPSVRPLLIVGGGAAADVVRAWSRTFALSEPISHELALQAMELTAALMAKIAPNCRLVEWREEAEACWRHGKWPVLCVSKWLSRETSSLRLHEGSGGQRPDEGVAHRRASDAARPPQAREGTEPGPADAEASAAELTLPQSWAATSDSLAAWAALKWDADELWLVKSTDLPAGMSFAEASRRGLVDDFFPQLAGRMPAIVWHNLRA
jgi:aspartokinase-like uncharacterized kinase